MICRFLGACIVLVTLTALVAQAAEEREKREPARPAADRPAPQSTPIFLPAHRDLLAKKTAGQIDVFFLGDSITRRWHGNDYPRFQENWKKNFHGWNAANFGWGGGLHSKRVVATGARRARGREPEGCRDHDRHE